MSLKGKFIAYVIESYTDEKHSFRRALFTPQIKKHLDAWLKEEEKKMEGTEKKVWYKSKAKLAVVIFSAILALEQISAAMDMPIVVPQFIKEALAALGVYGIRDAMQK